MIHIIYMAAGQSHRYGTNKLLEQYEGRPLYEHGLDALLRATDGRQDCSLIVVSCWQEIERSLRAGGIRCVMCPDSHLGVSYTIRAGIAACSTLASGDYLCFCVADQPLLCAETIARLLDVTQQAPLTACLCADGEQGNPVLFCASLAEELCALEGDRGGKAVMRRHPERHVDVPCAAEELHDIDIRA